MISKFAEFLNEDKYEGEFLTKYTGNFLTEEILEDFASIFEKYGINVTISQDEVPENETEGDWYIDIERDFKDKFDIINQTINTNYIFEFFDDVKKSIETIEKLLTTSYKVEFTTTGPNYNLIVSGDYKSKKIGFSLKITYIGK